jgi:hypothetical protein
MNVADDDLEPSAGTYVTWDAASYLLGNNSANSQAENQNTTADLVFRGVVVAAGFGATLTGGVVLAAGELVLSGIDNYCGGHTCRNFDNGGTSPQDVWTNVLTPSSPNFMTPSNAPNGSSGNGSGGGSGGNGQPQPQQNRGSSQSSAPLSFAQQIASIQAQINSIRAQLNQIIQSTSQGR